MSKSNADEHFFYDNLTNTPNMQVKKLRFHPYYYQGRKGSFYKSDKRVGVKITKIEKKDEELVLLISGKLDDNKIELKCSWKDIEFDYYTISCPRQWKIKFSKK